MVTQVFNVLANLDTSKATGPDEIPARILKETAHEIAPSLCELFNKSLRLGSLPTDWKLANVVPVFKKNNKEYAENYRPISSLYLVSKVMKCCMFNSIKDRMYSLIDSSQHSFITGWLYMAQLVEVLDYIGSQLNNRGQVDVIYLDLSTACDKVSHRKLLRKLCDYGFSGKLLVWLESYLQDRMQRVTALRVNSQALPVTPGVSQGSILGLMLFLLYANSHPGTVKSSHVTAFADGTKIFKSIKSPTDTALLQDDLSGLATWSSSVSLMFNESKCKASY